MKKVFLSFIYLLLFVGLFSFATLLVGCNEEEESTYTVKFVSDEIVLKEEKVENGKAATAPANPTKEGHIFDGWDKDFNIITSDLTVNAVFKANKYAVSFIDKDGNVLKVEEVDYAKSATAPNLVPVEGYEFIGWDKDFSEVKSDMVIAAQYLPKKYTVVFVDDNGEILKTEFVEYGKSATAPEVANKGSLLFKGWDKEYDSVTSNMTITAIYSGEIYSISYFDGTVKLNLTPNTYECGVGAELPVPEKEGYEFVGWVLSSLSLTIYNAADTSMSGDLKFYAKFVEIEKNELLVLPESTYNFTGITKKPHSTVAGQYVYQPNMPSEAPSGATNYDWSTSDETIATVSIYSSITAKSAGYCILTAKHKTSDVTINCVIRSSSDGITFATVDEANTIEICNIIFKGKNGEIIGTAKCQKGGAVIYPKPLFYEGYKFVGWDKANYNITAHTVITAQYEEGTNNYTGKTFSIIGDSISTYEGYIPSSFPAFYPSATGDVNDINKTWWMQTLNKLGGSLFLNNSYSGSCVGDSSSSATKNLSRLNYCVVNGQTPDVIMIYMGSNDCASKYVTLAQFDTGYKQMLQNLQQICPNSEIILCTLADSPFYTDDNMIAYNEAIRKYAAEFNCTLVDLESVSLAGLLVDSAHPDTPGMTVLAEKIVEELLR